MRIMVTRLLNKDVVHGERSQKICFCDKFRKINADKEPYDHDNGYQVIEQRGAHSTVQCKLSLSVSTGAPVDGFSFLKE